ncbi:hypothetical protein GUJ93_ZPchr0008g12403 [Zizania palustris]|uniref:Uncharacterized protein n=1 Tax=Zizania palustris TaxID=103762 RepID=A0A8J5R5B5_ZIZPA|nr:hypothetical protein GUJ93_ZPchr0008g12403 [Zizania palustris]
MKSPKKSPKKPNKQYKSLRKSTEPIQPHRYPWHGAIAAFASAPSCATGKGKGKSSPKVGGTEPIQPHGYPQRVAIATPVYSPSSVVGKGKSSLESGESTRPTVLDFPNTYPNVCLDAKRHESFYIVSWACDTAGNRDGNGTEPIQPHWYPRCIAIAASASALSSATGKGKSIVTGIRVDAVIHVLGSGSTRVDVPKHRGSTSQFLPLVPVLFRPPVAHRGSRKGTAVEV